MPEVTTRFKMELPLPNEYVKREVLNAAFKKVDSDAALKTDLDELDADVNQRLTDLEQDVNTSVATLLARAYVKREVPANTAQLYELREAGTYYLTNIANYTDRPTVESGAAASGNAYLITYAPVAVDGGYTIVQVTYSPSGGTATAPLNTHTRRLEISSTGAVSVRGWSRAVNSNGGTIAGNFNVNGTTELRGEVKLFGDGGAALGLYGTTHSYMQFFPQGQSAGRQGYIGFPSSGSKEFNVNATDVLRFSDKSGGITLGEIVGALYNGNIPATFLEIGYNRSTSAASFIDFHSKPGNDFDGRVIVDTDRNMTLQAPNRIYFQDQWRVMSLDGIYNDIQSVKQSGVDTKQKLVDALNAKRLASNTNEDFTTLINRVYTTATARDIGINGDAYTMNSYDGDFGTYTDSTGSGWRHTYASIFLYNVGNLIQFTPDIQYNSSAQFYLAAGGRGQITLRDDGDRALDIFPMYTWLPSGAGSGNRILLQVYSFTLDKAQRKLTIIRDVANPSDGVASQSQKFVVSVPNDFNLNGALRLRLNVGLPNGGYAANGQIAGRLYY